jgi:hypothetical protein
VQFVNRNDTRQLGDPVWVKPGHDRKVREIGVNRFSPCSDSRNSPGTPIDDYHLTIEISEIARAEVTVPLKLSDGNNTLRDAVDQRARSGDLRQGGMSNSRAIGERA